MKYALMAAILMGPSDGETVAWVFFSPDSPDSSALFEGLRAEGVAARPVLLTEQYFGAREPAEPFLATIRAAGEVRVVDDEGRRQAERWSIRELPAVVVERNGRAHLACGTRIDVKELLRCSK